MIAPAYSKLALKYAGKAVFLKVNVESNRQTAGHCQIRSMPTFIYYLVRTKFV
jgi:thioredoxin-like negative regulator of GroEL